MALLSREVFWRDGMRILIHSTDVRSNDGHIHLLVRDYILPRRHAGHSQTDARLEVGGV